MYDVIIIGGGPAGLAATTSCVHRGLETLLITKDFGGKTNLLLQLPFLDRHWTVPGTEVVPMPEEVLDEIRSLDRQTRR